MRAHQFGMWARFFAAAAKKPGFPGLRYRSGPAGALRAPSNPSRGARRLFDSPYINIKQKHLFA
jgi:hypothetical protein